MKNQNKYRKFQLQQKKIEALEKENTRFKKVYSEYKKISKDLSFFENKDGNSLCDDFFNAMLTQTSYLEKEIDDWLAKYNQKSNTIEPEI